MESHCGCCSQRMKGRWKRTLEAIAGGILGIGLVYFFRHRWDVVWTITVLCFLIYVANCYDAIVGRLEDIEFSIRQRRSQ